MGNTHLVPVVLLVGKHQEAPVVDEDADEVLGKDSSVTHPLAMPRARQDWQGGGADGQSGRGGASPASPSLGAAPEHLGARSTCAGHREQEQPPTLGGLTAPWGGSRVQGATPGLGPCEQGQGLAEQRERLGDRVGALTRTAQAGQAGDEEPSQPSPAAPTPAHHPPCCWPHSPSRSWSRGRTVNRNQGRRTG